MTAEGTTDDVRVVKRRRRPGLGSWSGGRWFVDADMAEQDFATLEPHEKLLSVLLLFCLRDGATEIVLHISEHDSSATEHDGVRLTYSVDGTWYELIPPPKPIIPPMKAELQWLVGLRSLRGRMAGLLRKGADRLDRRKAMTSAGSFLIGTVAVPVDVGTFFYEIAPGESRIVLAFARYGDEIRTAAAESLIRCGFTANEE